MLRINNIKIYLNKNETEDNLEDKLLKELKINKNELLNWSIAKKSLDSRKKDNIFWSYNLNFTTKIDNLLIKKKSVIDIEEYIYPIEKIETDKKVVIVGSGPAGLFSALILAQSGINPIVVEQGKDVYARKKDIEDFWENSNLNLTSNVQFGAGGAGTFSDGKLTTGVKDKRRIKLLDELIKAGAPKEIAYLAKPHIGTDKLITIVDNICNEIIALGGKILFETKFIDFQTTNNQVSSIDLKHKDSSIENIKVDHLILALGHSARDTFEMLFEKKIQMKAKPFSMGVRMEHLKEDVNKSQYGKQHKSLPTADYKFNVHTKDKRGVYTFCMCPGGVVVGAASEKNAIVTNGMSYFARDEQNSNSALLVSISTDDFAGDKHPLNGMYFQRKLEEETFKFTSKKYYAPVQKVGDFLNNTVSDEFTKVIPSYKPGIESKNLNELFPKFMSDSLHEALIELRKRIPFMNDNEAVLTAIESRSSSPITILRDEKKMSNIQNIYPCGEGAGYAGGIVSAAIDGIRCAESVIENI